MHIPFDAPMASILSKDSIVLYTASLAEVLVKGTFRVLFIIVDSIIWINNCRNWPINFKSLRIYVCKYIKIHNSSVCFLNTKHTNRPISLRL